MSTCKRGKQWAKNKSIHDDAEPTPCGNPGTAIKPSNKPEINQDDISCQQTFLQSHFDASITKLRNIREKKIVQNWNLPSQNGRSHLRIVKRTRKWDAFVWHAHVFITRHWHPSGGSVNLVVKLDKELNERLISEGTCTFTIQSYPFYSIIISFYYFLNLFIIIQHCLNCEIKISAKNKSKIKEIHLKNHQ